MVKCSCCWFIGHWTHTGRTHQNPICPSQSKGVLHFLCSHESHLHNCVCVCFFFCAPHSWSWSSCAHGRIHVLPKGTHQLWTHTFTQVGGEWFLKKQIQLNTGNNHLRWPDGRRLMSVDDSWKRLRVGHNLVCFCRFHPQLLQQRSDFSLLLIRQQNLFLTFSR